MSDPPPDAAPSREAEPTESPLGEKTTSVILALLQDFYRLELGAEEDVHRTLPFFAAASGVIVALLNHSATQLPAWSTLLETCSQGGSSALSWHSIPCMWSVVLAGLSLTIVVCLSIAVWWYIWLATRRRDYERIGPEVAIVASARELHTSHANKGISGENLDTTVAADVRDGLLKPFSEAVEKNRNANLERYRYRAGAVRCLLLSLFFALLSTLLIILPTKFGITEASP